MTTTNKEKRCNCICMREIVWKDKSGKEYTIQDIEDSHLLNILPVAKRQLENARYIDNMDMEWVDIDFFSRRFEILVKEAVYRKLINKDTYSDY